MDPAEIAERLVGSGKPVTVDRIAKLPRLIQSDADYETLLTLLPPADAAIVKQIADVSRAKGETTWVFTP